MRPVFAKRSANRINQVPKAPALTAADQQLHVARYLGPVNFHAVKALIFPEALVVHQRQGKI
jgi:hypothetical protein